MDDGRWKMDAGQRERRLLQNDNSWTMDDGRSAERTTVVEDDNSWTMDDGRWTLGRENDGC
jgi:hypothetical protein